MEGKETAIVSVLAVIVLLIGVLIGASIINPEVVVVERNVTIPGEPEIVYVNVTETIKDSRVDTLISELKPVKQLEEDAELAVIDELDKDYLEDVLVESGIDVDRVKSYSIDEDETEVRVLSYDFDNEDEDKAEVTLKVKVRYNLEEGNADDFKKVLYVTGVYSLDDGDEEVEFD